MKQEPYPICGIVSFRDTIHLNSRSNLGENLTIMKKAQVGKHRVSELWSITKREKQQREKLGRATYFLKILHILLPKASSLSSNKNPKKSSIFLHWQTDVTFQNMNLESEFDSNSNIHFEKTQYKPHLM